MYDNDDDDRQRTKKRSEKLTWAFSSGELKGCTKYKNKTFINFKLTYTHKLYGDRLGFLCKNYSRKTKIFNHIYNTPTLVYL